MKQEPMQMTGYTLATDQNYGAMKCQICEVVKAGLATGGIQKFNAQISRIMGQTEEQKQKINRDINFTQEEEKAAETIENPSDPREIKDYIQAKGILAIVIPKNRKVSDKQIKAGELADGRVLSQGMNIMLLKKKGTEYLALREYAMQMLPNFMRPREKDGLQYQVEYLIAGRHSDQENLKSVLHKIIGLREVSNLAYLMTDPVKRAETLSMATAICTMLLAPWLIPAMAVTIRAIWAYAESVMDVKQLLAGGKVPVVKTNKTWKLSMSGLANRDTYTREIQKGTGSGLDYEAYLRMLLVTKKHQEICARIAAMIEHTMRDAYKKEKFCLDHCLHAVEIQAGATVGNRELTCIRGYAYMQN
jgi:hypothetical protein